MKKDKQQQKGASIWRNEERERERERIFDNCRRPDFKMRYFVFRLHKAGKERNSVKSVRDRCWSGKLFSTAYNKHTHIYTKFMHDNNDGPLKFDLVLMLSALSTPSQQPNRAKEREKKDTYEANK